MKRLSFSAAVAALVLGAAAMTHGYSSYARWSTVPVTMVVNPTNADVTASAAITAIQYAMNVWNTQSGSSFRYQYGGTATDTATAHDNRNVMLFRNTKNGSTIGTTYSWWDLNNRLLDADVVLWDGGFKFFTGTTGCGVVANAVYLEDIATHELGHVLGLNHSTYSNATMYPSYGYCSQAFRTLASDDINAARALYPATVSANTAPTVVITSPANGATFAVGTTLALKGTATDKEDGTISSKLQWTDNGRTIGTGSILSTAISLTGTHTIAAKVTDSGALQGSSQVSVTLTAALSGATGNTAPTVVVTSPTNGKTFPPGTTISLKGTATDNEDGTISSKLQWTDNGKAIGTGAITSTVISLVGTHTLAAKVTDSGALQGSSQVSITIK